MEQDDVVVCNELLQEILLRLPPPSCVSASLVCKRWLSVLRSSRSSLSLRYSPSLPSILSHYPSLRSLTVVVDSSSYEDAADRILLAVASTCTNLLSLRCLSSSASASPSALRSLASSSPSLTSLTISSLLHLNLRWLSLFPSLSHLSILNCSPPNSHRHQHASHDDDDDDGGGDLPLESLSLTGIGPGDHGLGWLWRRCTRLRRLRLRGCEGTGDGGALALSPRCLAAVEDLELRTCRSIVDALLPRIAERCPSLSSLLVYDGGSRDGIHRFLANPRPSLRCLDLRLPLDLEDDHLSAAAGNLPSLSSLHLQSSCLVTGHGLRPFARALSTTLQDLSLINCDAVERELGLLTSLGQILRSLRKLDLSYNESLPDKELASMLASSTNLIHINLRGCGTLTSAILASVLHNCPVLETIDVIQCRGITSDAVEVFVLNSPRLNQISVEEAKLSDAARTWAARKHIGWCHY